MTQQTPYEQTDLYKLRHSAAHVMAQAVVEMFPEAKLAIGPPIEDGFYYDFDLPRTLTPDDLSTVEKRMREIIAGNHRFQYRELTAAQARELFAEQPYKLELIEGLAQGQTDENGNQIEGGVVISTYKHDSFEDLCRGPHVDGTRKINPDALKLIKVAGAYWRGDEHRPMLQRIYGTLWSTPKELEEHLWRLEEAKKRDHRKIGEDLKLFTFSPEIGRGLPLWLPRGTIIRDALEDWAKKTERKWGYQRISTPHLTRGELYYISGHLPYYKDDLYAPIDIEGDEYYLKPMNCPHHHMVYKAHPHSYRELPIRYAEYGTVYRYEKSGQLHGLMRVRGFCQNDAHIYCSLEQAKKEFLDVMRLHEYYYSSLGITDYHMVLALRDPNNTTKYHDDVQMWTDAERITREAMDESGIPYVEDIGGAAHYGPKVDFIVRSVTGKEFAASTNQVDLYMPKRFDLTYVDDTGKDQFVVVIHRAPLGSHERFVAFLTEHYAGAFPAWLAPTQVQMIPIADRHVEYARTVAARLFDLEFRAEVDDSNERMQNKIRQAQLQKTPYMLVVGDREAASDAVSVRLRSGENLGSKTVAEFTEILQRVVSSKSLSLSLEAVGTGL
ncbi:MAG: threonine--tRNA ligase [Acidobacteriota bacterium]